MAIVTGPDATILVVEPVRWAGAVLARALAPGHGVVQAPTAELALERLLLDPTIGAVVVDVDAVPAAGEPLLTRLRASPVARLRALAVVVLSDLEDTRLALTCLSLGALAVVARARAGDDLVGSLRAALRGSTPATAADAAATNASQGAAPASVLRFRWRVEASPHGEAIVATVSPEAMIRSGDWIRVDADHAGCVVRLACRIEESLRPVARLVSSIALAATRGGYRVALAARLAPEPGPGATWQREQAFADLPALPNAGELAIATPAGFFRLNLSQ